MTLFYNAWRSPEDDDAGTMPWKGRLCDTNELSALSGEVQNSVSFSVAIDLVRQCSPSDGSGRN